MKQRAAKGWNGAESGVHVKIGRDGSLDRGYQSRLPVSRQGQGSRGRMVWPLMESGPILPSLVGTMVGRIGQGRVDPHQYLMNQGIVIPAYSPSKGEDPPFQAVEGRVQDRPVSPPTLPPPYRWETPAFTSSGGPH